MVTLSSALTMRGSNIAAAVPVISCRFVSWIMVVTPPPLG